MGFPIISIKHLDSDFENISGKIFKASQEWGFFIVTDHGITDAIRMFDLSRQFFNLPMDVKSEKVLNELGVGYDGHKANSFAASEGMALGLPAGQLVSCSNIHTWWDTAKLGDIESFKAQCHSLSLKILSCFAVRMGLARDFFAVSHNDQDLPGNALKFMKYPKLAAIPEGHTDRLSAHTDWGSLTLLFMESPGLEVRSPNDTWHDVPVVPGGIVVNIGDLLSFWTDKHLKSTMHRVSWEKVPFDQDRYSIPYFIQPNFATDLQPLTGPAEIDAKPLTYKDYYHTRIQLMWGSVISKDGKKESVDVDRRLAQYLADLDAAKAQLAKSNGQVEA